MSKFYNFLLVVAHLSFLMMAFWCTFLGMGIYLWKKGAILPLLLLCIMGLMFFITLYPSFPHKETHTHMKPLQKLGNVFLWVLNLFLLILILVLIFGILMFMGVKLYSAFLYFYLFLTYLPSFTFEVYMNYLSWVCKMTLGMVFDYDSETGDVKGIFNVPLVTVAVLLGQLPLQVMHFLVMVVSSIFFLLSKNLSELSSCMSSVLKSMFNKLSLSLMKLIEKYGLVSLKVGGVVLMMVIIFSHESLVMALLVFLSKTLSMVMFSFFVSMLPFWMKWKYISFYYDPSDYSGENEVFYFFYIFCVVFVFSFLSFLFTWVWF